MRDTDDDLDDAELHREDTDDDQRADDRYDDGDDVVGRDEYVEDVYEDDEYDTEYDDDTYDDEDDGSWWDVGLIGLLLIAGVALFLFPEPFTSTIGIVLIALGIVAWVADALT